MNWPILGPCNVRDTAGRLGDLLLDPRTYFIPSAGARIAVNAFERTNYTSLRLGNYEELKEMSLDPYIALRSAYQQVREREIRRRRSVWTPKQDVGFH